MSKLPKLQILLPTILVAWLVGCVAVHGPAIFAYLALHAVTTGVFAAFMWRSERAMLQRTTGSVRRAAVERKPEPARADQKAAVA